jgi:hypothetical protein
MNNHGSDTVEIISCPHCQRDVLLANGNVKDSYFYAQRGFRRSINYRLSPILDQFVGGMGGIAFGSTFVFLNASRMYRWIGLSFPRLGHPYARWLCVLPPLAFGSALSAGLGRGILPALVETTLKLYYTPSETILGLMRDIDTKK